ncbi:MAG: HD domain-containing protein [Bacteroidales bacterium]|nr:HD domain-containing protein [Bacteroidales bacterium]
MTNKRKIFNDPVYGFLTIDDDVLFDVISHPYFQRQRHIKQLGFTYMVYPGAVHSRFSHMLGALNLMGRAIDVLRVKGVDITAEEALGAKLAILLHDVGHGPFSHTSEYMLANVPHEVCSELFMERINTELGGRLSTAIAIFNDTYPKHFLHQLVSSQLDMDRLDYLSRDSFFSGVSEGVVGTERIINMLNVHDDALVVDEKGIYSIEKFIISRRLMYWQVYLHKTVVAADVLLYNILRRARYCLSQGQRLEGSRALLFFLQHKWNEDDFRSNSQLLSQFALIDDNDVWSAAKDWMIGAEDHLLRTLCRNLVERRLSAVKVSEKPFDDEVVDSVRRQACESLSLNIADADYCVATGKHVNHAYDFNDQEIKVLFKDGRCLDISEASDQLDRHFLEKSVTKYYIYYPKELKNRVAL